MANEEFRKKDINVDAPVTLYAGLNLTRFESKITHEGIECDLYVDKNGKISVQFKSEGKKIKTNLKLPAVEVTYLRYIMDSHFIPLRARIKKASKGFKVEVNIA